ncbi:phage tail tape measure protein [Rhodopseudomonas sp. AAP120]|uniref:phage tail tape measure protein n=1 Tax=Rhodopseudomonas sp. AAP120 TaxID=1523430 RepID=UPI0018D1D34F|nr:phage tail tape measure protein [Rhodopseudomonas sp. AAP120]
MPAIIGMGARATGVLGAGYLAYRTAANSVRTVVDQDKAWAEVRKKVNNATPEDLGKLDKQLRATARRYGLSISEVFEQAAEAGAAGIDKSDLVKFVELTTRASVGWDTTARETAQRIAEIRAATEMTLPQIDDLANKINALGDNSAAKERDIVEMFHRSGAAAKAAGVQYDDTLAILTAIRSTGMQEEVASRWFNSFVFDMAGANAKGDKVKEAWKRLGFDPKALASGMKTDATGTIMKVFEAINKLEQTKKIEVLSAIFGQGWQDETARAAQAIEEIKKQVEFVRNPANWKGSLQSNLDIQLSTTANHWERIKTAASEAANQINRATGATGAFNSITEALLQRFEKMLGLGKDGKPAEPEKPRADEPAGAKSKYAGRMQSYEHAKATRAALTAAKPKMSDFSGRFQSQNYAKALAQWEREQRAYRTERGAANAVPEPRNYSPVPSFTPPKFGRRGGTPSDSRNFTPVPPAAASEAEGTMQRISRAVASESAKAVAESKSAAEQIRAMWNFQVSPQISPRFSGPAGAAPSSGATPAPATPAPAAPSGKRASLGGRGIQVGSIIVNGAGRDGNRIGQDIARQLAKLGDSSSALFDTATV